MRNPLVYILGLGTAVGLAVLAMGGRRSVNGVDLVLDEEPYPDTAPDETPDPDLGGTTARAQPVAVGPVNDPEIAALLTEMQDVFASEGVNLSWVTPREVMTMRKAPGRPVAIPPRPYWYLMARTLREAYDPVRAAFGEGVNIYNGYRPPDYNKVVTCKRKNAAGECIKWSRGSRHQWAQAVDLLPVNATGENRRRLARIAAALFVDRGHALRMGFGVYGNPDFPTGVHLDVGYKRRTWGQAAHFVNEVTQA